MRDRKKISFELPIEHFCAMINRSNNQLEYKSKNVEGEKIWIQLM